MVDGLTATYLLSDWWRGIDVILEEGGRAIVRLQYWKFLSIVRFYLMNILYNICQINCLFINHKEYIAVIF